MKCLHCGNEVVLTPSAAKRAKKDMTGKDAAYYTSLFPYHSTCTLELRAKSSSELITRLKGYITP